MRLNLPKLLVTSLVLCVLALPTCAAPPDDDLLLQKAQGTWEEQKGERRLVITIKGSERTSSTYSGDKLLRRYTSQLTITTTEKLAILSYRDMHLIEGEGPKSIKGPFSLILKFRDEKSRDGTVMKRMILAGGLFRDDETSPRLRQFHKIAQPANE